MDGKAHPPTVVVPVVTQPCSQLDYKLKCTGAAIFLIIAAVVDLALFITIGVTFQQWQHSIYTTGFCFRLVLGILTIVSSNRNYYGTIIAVHIWCCINYIHAFVQVILCGLDFSAVALPLFSFLGYPVVMIIDLVCILFAISVIITAIVIQVNASRVTCCRPLNQTGPTPIIIQQGYSQPPGYSQPGYSAQPPPPAYGY